MPRLLSALLCSLALLVGACRHAVTEDPEPAGPLEGTWRVGLTDPVTYDVQGKVLGTYTPVADLMDYTQLRFTATELEEYSTRTNARNTIHYVRTGDELTCPAPSRSYTIRKLTARHLDLYLRGEYFQTGTFSSRTDFTIHLDRQ